MKDFQVFCSITISSIVVAELACACTISVDTLSQNYNFCLRIQFWIFDGTFLLINLEFRIKKKNLGRLLISISRALKNGTY